MRLPRLTPYVLAALACGRQLHGATAAFELESTRPLAMSLTRPQSDTWPPSRGACMQWQISHDIPFGLPDLAGHRFVIAHRRRPVALRFGLSIRGPSRHREIAMSAGGDARLPSGSITSVALTRYHIDQDAVGSRRGWGMSLALEMALRTGLSVIVAGRGAADPFVERRLELQVVRRWGSDGSATVTLEKDASRSHRLRTMAVRQIDARLRLQMGTSSGPRQFAAGAAARAGGTQLQYLIRTHAHLGPTHAVALGHDGECL